MRVHHFGAGLVLTATLLATGCACHPFKRHCCAPPPVAAAAPCCPTPAAPVPVAPVPGAPPPGAPVQTFSTPPPPVTNGFPR
jgi:hypothetical protein